MTIDQLYYFISAAEEETFFNAAERSNITQSTLSKHIMKLESELGVTLLDRSHRSASLTQAGQEFYQQALTMTQQYEQMLTALSVYKNPTKKEIHIGALPILLQEDIAERISAFLDTYPDYSISLAESEEKELLAGLKSGEYDLIIARENLVSSSAYVFDSFVADELAVILPEAHARSMEFLENGTAFPIQELNGARLLMMHTYTSVCQRSMELLAEYNLQPGSVRHARVESILSGVSLGEGIGLIPAKTLASFRKNGLVAVPIDPTVSLNIVSAHLKNQKLSPGASMLIKVLSKGVVSTV